MGQRGKAYLQNRYGDNYVWPTQLAEQYKRALESNGRSIDLKEAKRHINTALDAGLEAQLLNQDHEVKLYGAYTLYERMHQA